MFTHLHGHSTYSFLEAIGSPKDIVKKAKELWFSAIGMSDFNSMAGAIQFYQAAKAEGIKAIVGSETGFTLDINNVTNIKNVGNVNLLATSSQGYLNLLKIISFATQEGNSGKPKIDIETIKKYKEGILIFFGGLDSRIAKMLGAGEPLAKIEEILLELKKILWEKNIYLEIIAQEEIHHQEIANLNKNILELSKKTEISLIVGNLYHYPNPKDKKTYELAMAIKDNLKLYDPQHRVPTTENHIMSKAEIVAICQKNGYSEQEIQSRIDNNNAIAERVDINIEMGQALFPNYQTPDNILELYEKNKEGLIFSEDEKL